MRCRSASSRWCIGVTLGPLYITWEPNRPNQHSEWASSTCTDVQVGYIVGATISGAACADSQGAKKRCRKHRNKGTKGMFNGRNPIGFSHSCVGEQNTAEHSYVSGAITAQSREHKISARRKEKHGDLLLFEFKAI